MPRAIQSCNSVFSFSSRKLKQIGLLCALLFAFSVQLNAGAKEKLADSLKQVLSEQKIDTLRIKTLIKISQTYLAVNKDSAMKYAVQLLREAEASDSVSRVCDAYIILGSCFNAFSEEDSAMSYKRKSYALAKQINYVKGIANGANDIGLYLKDYGDYDSSIYYVLESITIREANKIEKPLGVSYNNLGLIYQANGDTTNAMICFRKAQVISGKFNDFKVRDAVINNIASLYDDMHKYDSAMYYYRLGLAFSDSLEDAKGKSRGLINMGVLYRNIGEFTTSANFLLDGLRIKDSIGDKNGVAIASYELAETFRMQKKFAESEKLLKRADTLAQALKSKELLRSVYLAYAQVYKESNRAALALEYYEKYDQLNNEILNEEKINAVEEMRTRFGTVKKERENAQLREQQLVLEAASAEEERKKKILVGGVIALLIVLGFAAYAYRTKIKANAQISKQNSTLRELNKKLIDSEEELTALNATKDQLFSIISHDLGNPVNAIVNYNSVVQSKKESMTKEEMAQSLEKMNLTLRPLQEFLENLLQWSVQQKNGIRIKKEKFSIAGVVDEIAALYQGSMEAKQLQLITTAVGDVNVNTDKNIVRLVLRNLIGNAIKFSPVGSRIDVGIDTTGGKLVISVADKGAGISKEKLEKIQQGGIITSERGTAMETGTGLGLNLVREFLNALGGKLEIESESGRTVVSAYLAC